MLDALSAVLHSGIELVFFMAMVVIYLLQRSEHQLCGKFLRGSMAGVIASLAVYGLNQWMIRIEMLDVVAKGLLVLALVLFIARFLARRRLERWSASIFYVLGFALLLDKTGKILDAYIPIVGMESGFNSEWVLRGAAALFGTVLLILMALGMNKIGGIIGRRFSARFLAFTLAVLLAGQIIEWLQLLFGLRLLPLSFWVLYMLMPFVNHKSLLFYGQIAIMALFLLLTAQQYRRMTYAPIHGALNPAQIRKRIAGALRSRNWFLTMACVQFLIMIAALGNNVLAARQPAEKPAVAIRPENGHFRLPKAKLLDKELNVFSYEFNDHTQVRLLAVRKAGENFGVALDACPICGTAGYYQKDGQIICKKCGSVVSMMTIGFKGGCNPIPVKYEMKADGTIDVALAELESAKPIFQ